MELISLNLFNIFNVKDVYDFNSFDIKHSSDVMILGQYYFSMEEIAEGNHNDDLLPQLAQ